MAGFFSSFSFMALSTFLAFIGIYLAIKGYLSGESDVAVFILASACIGILFINYLNLPVEITPETSEVTANVQVGKERIERFKRETERAAQINSKIKTEKSSEALYWKYQREMDSHEREQRRMDREARQFDIEYERQERKRQRQDKANLSEMEKEWGLR